MNSFPSRKERKALAKRLGLTKKKETFKERCERISRSIEFGKKIHIQHLQDLENTRIQSEKQSEENLEKVVPLAPANSPNWNLEEFKHHIISDDQTSE